MSYQQKLGTKNNKPHTTPAGIELQIRKLSQGEVEQLRREYTTPDKQAAGIRFIANRCAMAKDDATSRIWKDSELADMAGEDFEELNSIADAVIEFSGLNKKKSDA